MVQENIYNRQDNKVDAAVDSSKKESTNKESKALSEKDAKVIRQFLASVGPYEADALRIAISLADGKATVATLSSDDQLALNRFLNSGLNKEQNNTQQIQVHRIHRATNLSKRVVDFCGKLQLLAVYEAMMALAVDAGYIEQARAGLDKLAAGRPTSQTGIHSSATNSSK
jgi:hypothetical protein